MDNDLRKEIFGVDEELPLLNGSKRIYVNFDNAASTPPLKRVVEKVNQFLKFYSSIHRGTGFKSRLATHFYEEARRLAGEFVGYDPENQVVIFGKNTTEMVNKLAYRLNMPPNSVVIVSQMEHHSNDLPWRFFANVLHAPISLTDGTLKVNVLKELIQKNREKLFLVAITGASNVTGNINPIYEIAREAHQAGAYFMVDAAQLVPHRPIDCGKTGDPESIDFLVYSAHKMFAPFGTGVLVARKDLLKDDAPEYRGGGTVRVVGWNDVIWDDSPERDEAGSPNVVGAIALAEAIKFYEEIGYEKLEEIENNLARQFLGGLQKIPQITIYGRRDNDFSKRMAVIPFNIESMEHSKAAAILAYEFGIGVRNGCFCAHPYLKLLLNVCEEEERQMINNIVSGRKVNIPGAIRASFSFYNTEEEVEYCLQALKKIIGGAYSGKYRLDEKSGQYFPADFREDFSNYFSF